VSTESQRQSRGWCSLRLRFDERELVLLRGAERLRGFALAQQPRPEELRTALNLAKAGHKLSSATPSASIVLDETEVGLLLDALRFALPEVQWATRAPEHEASPRRDAVFTAFPELTDRGGWRSFGLTRELEAVATRLKAALNS
jgi:hypothetical protein